MSADELAMLSDTAFAVRAAEVEAAYLAARRAWVADTTLAVRAAEAEDAYFAARRARVAVEAETKRRREP